MGALFGTLSALTIGCSDLFGRRMVRASNALTAAAVMHAVAIVVSALAIVGLGGTFTARDLVIGLGSGLGLGVGMATYYEGIARSSSTVVAPLVAVISAVIPFGYAVAKGASSSGLAYAGAAVAGVGLLLITIGGGEATHVRTGLWWGSVSGVAYGVGFAVIIETSSDAGAWPALSQRVAAAGLLAALAVRRRLPVIPPVGARRVGLIGGTFAGLSTITYLIGIRDNATAAVVTSSMFPAFTVAIGRVVFGDRVSRLQAVGIAVVLAGIIGVVTG